MTRALWPRRLPPYGKAVLDLRRVGKRPADGVFVTDAWAPARYLREVMDMYAVVVPHADVWELGFLRGLDVVLIHDRPDALGLAMQIAEAQPATFGSLTFREWLDLSTLIVRGDEAQTALYWATQFDVPIDNVRTCRASLAASAAAAA